MSTVDDNVQERQTEPKMKSEIYFTYTRFRVVADFSSLGTIARAAGRRRLTLVLAAQRRTTQSGCKNKTKTNYEHSPTFARVFPAESKCTTRGN